MNKLSKILLIFIVTLSSCNPMNDTYNLLNKNVQSPQEKFSYTLTNADYVAISSSALADATNTHDSLIAKSIKSTNSLPEGYASTYVPAILKKMYPALGKGSTSLVSFNFNRGPITSLVEYTSADRYTLANTDYKSMGGAVMIYKYFSPSNPPGNYLPDFLKNKYPDAADSTLKTINYKYATTDPSGGEVNIFDEEFNGSLGDFQTVSITGDQNWTAASYKQDQYAKMSGHLSSTGKNYNNEDWLISPAINLSGFSDPNVQIEQAINYLHNQWNQTTVQISTDFTGDITTATWTPVTISTLPTGSNWTFVTSEKIDLSAYSGKTIHIAFKYVSDTNNAATWEVNWVKVNGTISGSGNATPNVIKESGLYRMLNGSWATEPDVYILNSEDYNSMGAPGKYGNFSSSVPPDNYLSQFLSQKYPYAQEGEQIVVMYKYYSGGTHIRADEYTFTNQQWAKYNPIEMKTGQFINTGTKWVFDPTVIFTMNSTDYQLIVDAVKADPNKKQLVNSYGTGEYYYGSDSHYGDFDARISQRNTAAYPQPEYKGLSEADAIALIQKRIKEGVAVMLQAKFPNAVAQVSGIDVMYVVTYKVYENDGSTETPTVTFQCTKSGPNPEFTLVDNPAPSK
jgi:hypothetical protein